MYVDGKKIASLGLRIKNGSVYHGLALNVDMDLAPFQQINPCGYAGMEMAQIADFVQPAHEWDAVADCLSGHLLRELAVWPDKTNRSAPFNWAKTCCFVCETRFAKAFRQPETDLRLRQTGSNILLHRSGIGFHLFQFNKERAAL